MLRVLGMDIDHGTVLGPEPEGGHLVEEDV